MSDVQATTFDETALREIFKQIEDRWQPLHDKMAKRRAHFHNLPEALTPLPPPYDQALQFQSDKPRQAHSKVKARLTENHFTIEAKAYPDTPTRRAKADDLTDVLNSGIPLVEERQRLNIQGALADGQVIYGFGVLHWLSRPEVYPDVPDYAELDSVDQCDMCEGTGKASGKKCPNCGGSGQDTGDGNSYTTDDYPDEANHAPKGKKYRQTDESLQQNRSMDQARAGFPYGIEVPYPDTFMAVEDTGMVNGLGMVLLKREVGLLDYFSKLDNDAVSANDADSNVSLYGERDAPTKDMPSAAEWGSTVTLYSFWTRDEFYEVVKGKGQNFEIKKSGKHGWTMPPFAIAPAIEVHEADPVLRYEPYLEGVFRVKVHYDRIVALYQVIAEMIALPYYYWVNTGNGESWMGEDGNLAVFTRNAAMSMKAPDGYELRQLPFELNPAFVDAMRFLGDELQGAMPASGTAELSASTQAWAIRLQQAQESVEPSRLMANQSLAIQTMVRSIVQDMSGREEPISTFRRMTNGMIDKDTVVQVDPKDISSLDVQVDIDNVSAAERITKVEHGRSLLDDPLVPITAEVFVRDYMGEPDPQSIVMDWQADKIFNEKVMPGVVAQELKRFFGTNYVAGPDGMIIGPDGQQATPEQVLGANGIAPQQPQPQGPPPQPATGVPGVPPPPPPSMGGLPGLAAPTTMPLQGMVG